jgi:hypothetical protein
MSSKDDFGRAPASAAQKNDKHGSTVFVGEEFEEPFGKAKPSIDAFLSALFHELLSIRIGQRYNFAACFGLVTRGPPPALYSLASGSS